MSARRKAAFDPSRLDELDDVLEAPLPHPQPPTDRAGIHEPAGPPTPRPAPPEPVRPIADQDVPTDTAPEPLRRPRGTGGRPTRVVLKRASTAQGSTVAVAVRIPPVLYSDVNQDLLAGPERPSYGQLVIWACEDHPEAVVETIRAARRVLGHRRPRGHRLAAPDVQITLRITTGERELLDEIGNQVQPGDGKPITRTEVAIAALKQALMHPSDDEPSHHMTGG